MGKKHGKCMEWYENGQKESEIEYLNGNENGKAIRWSKNGVKIHELEYKEGKPYGKWIFWDEKGKGIKEREDHFIYKGSSLITQRIWWYPNGEKRKIAEFEDGKMIGKLQEWNIEGKVVENVIFIDYLDKKTYNENNVFKYKFPEIDLPENIKIGKQLSQNLMKEETQLLFFDVNTLDQYFVIHNGIRFVITTLPGTKMINHIFFEDATIMTPEGVSIGDPLKFVLKFPDTKVEMMEGYGYWVILPSGWSAVFFQGQSTTQGKLKENAKVKLIARGGWLSVFR
jgi:antitoxin component YwqK of YwqJK toxin-antitoxin module